VKGLWWKREHMRALKQLRKLQLPYLGIWRISWSWTKARTDQKEWFKRANQGEAITFSKAGSKDKEKGRKRLWQWLGCQSSGKDF